jgi:hypothetical protein
MRHFPFRFHMTHLYALLSVQWGRKKSAKSGLEAPDVPRKSTGCGAPAKVLLSGKIRWSRDLLPSHHSWSHLSYNQLTGQWGSPGLTNHARPQRGHESERPFSTALGEMFLWTVLESWRGGCTLMLLLPGMTEANPTRGTLEADARHASEVSLLNCP